MNALKQIYQYFCGTILDKIMCVLVILFVIGLLTGHVKFVGDWGKVIGL